MKEFIKKTLRWIYDTYEEADSVDPWPSKPGDLNPRGVRLFNLVAIHLQDHGYYPRLYRNNNMMVVYKSRWRRLIDKRVGSVAFEIGSKGSWWPIYNNKTTSVWSWGFGKAWALHAGSSVSDDERPCVVCEISDPFAINLILKKVDEYYKNK